VSGTYGPKITGPDKKSVTAINSNISRPLAEMQANAWLIAAAPEMLQELKAIYNAWPEVDDGEPISGSEMVQWYCEIRTGLKQVIELATWGDS
jgi:hypothetical protein